MKAIYPTPEMIKALRATHGVTQAYCADILHMHKHGFQKYEYGAREMHPAFWELLNIRLAKRAIDNKRTRNKGRYAS